MVRRALALAAMSAVVLAGCGEDRAAKPPQSIATVAMPVDCTASVRGDQARWPHAIATLASRTLPRHRALLTGCFFGPKRGVQWLEAFDPRSLPENLTGGEPARRRYAENYGLLLEPVLERELRPHSKPKGTNWLGALVTSARVPSVDSVWLFSDLVQQADHVHLTRPFRPGELQRIVKRWAPPMAPLDGIEVVAIGAGEGVARPAAARRGERLLKALAKTVGFRLRFQTVVG